MFTAVFLAEATTELGHLPTPTLRGATHVPALGTDRYTRIGRYPRREVLTRYNHALLVSSCTESVSRAVRPAAVQRTLSEELRHRVLSRSSEAEAGCGFVVRDAGCGPLFL